MPEQPAKAWSPIRVQLDRLMYISFVPAKAFLPMVNVLGGNVTLVRIILLEPPPVLRKTPSPIDDKDVQLDRSRVLTEQAPSIA